MANTRSMTRNKRFKTCDDDSSTPWSDLVVDMLLLIMMRLGVVDFISFSGVCKQWRSVALLHWSKFMVSRKPMYMSLSKRVNQKECYLEDFEGRKFRCRIPHSTHRTCVGSTRGYLILWGERASDFWLVNPITRHELHFPRYPYPVNTWVPGSVRAVLVFSPSMSGWVFLLSCKFYKTICFSVADENPCWNSFSFDYHILDLHVFKGKIYTTNCDGHICEVRLNPEPTLTLLGIPNLNFSIRHEFVSSDENLYVIGWNSEGVDEANEVDVGKMRWVNPKETIGGYAVFVSDFKCSAAIKPDTWAQPLTHCKRFNYICQTKNEDRRFTNMWYFPHDCLNFKQQNSCMEAMNI